MKLHNKMIKDYETIGTIPANDDKYYVIKNGEWVEYKVPNELFMQKITIESIPPGGKTGETLIANSIMPDDYSWAPIPEITNPIEVLDDLDSELTEEDKTRAISSRAATFVWNFAHEILEELDELSELDNTIAQLKEVSNNN